MHIISKEDDAKIQEKIFYVNLPLDWWSITDSFSYYAKGENTKVQIIPLKTSVAKKTLEKEDQREVLPTPSEWDFSKGDYHIQETASTNKDYAYNNRLKIRFIKYAIYPALTFALLFTLLVLNTIFECKFKNIYNYKLLF